MSSAGSYGGSGGGGVGSVLFLTGNSGGPVAPDLTGNINIVGTGAITVVDTPGTHTLTIELTGSVATEYDADTGTAIPVLGILNINGASGIQTTASGNTVVIELSGGGIVESITGDAGGAVTGAITITGGSSGAFYTGSGGDTLTTTFTKLVMSDSSPTTGFISIGGDKVLSCGPGVASNNIFVGQDAGNATLTGLRNSAVGSTSLAAATIAEDNTSVGYATLNELVSGTANVCMGTSSMANATSAGGNTCVGFGTGFNLLTGQLNTILGYSAGTSYTAAESSNILIGNLGVGGDTNQIRIGTQGSSLGQQNACTIAGIYGSTVGGTNAAVFIDNNGVLGTVGGSGGGVSSITGDAGGALTGAITITGGASGAFYTGSGGNTLTTTFTKLVMSDTTATTGYIQIGADIVMAAWGGVANNQIFVGEGSGNATLSGIQNAALGGETLASLTSGGANAAVGYHALTDCTTGSDNVAVGEISLATLTTGSRNVAVGQAALDVLATGSDNIAIGEGAGSNYSGAESSNILIGDSGTLAESNVIRIGTQGSGAGQQNTAYMAGITGSSVGVTNAIVYCDNTGKLGTTGGTFPSLGTTNHAVQVGNSSGGLTSLSVGTNGQVLVGSSGANPVFATLTSTGSSITYTTGAGTLNLDLTSPVSIAHGGTNATSMTNTDGVVYYDGTRLVTTTVGTSGQILTSNGAGVAPTFQAAAGGGVTSITGDTGGAITGALSITGGSSGAIFNTSGANITESFQFLRMSDSTSTTGYIQIGTQKVLNCYGGVANNNIFVGQGAGHTTVSGTDNDALGALALSAVTTGSYNVAIGSSAMQPTTTSSSNVAIGLNVLGSLTTGSGNNTAIGFVALGNMTTGDNNIAIGSTAGDGYTGAESSNVAIAAQGTAGESNVIRIGTQGSGAGQQNACFIAGIAGVTIASTAAVLVNTSTGQLGTVISSRRFKENIDDMGAVSRDLHKLRPVKFNFKGDYNESYGLIAEDVEEIMPHLVSYDSEGLPATVKYHELPALLLNEIQRLKLKIDELEGKLNSRVR